MSAASKNSTLSLIPIVDKKKVTKILSEEGPVADSQNFQDQAFLDRLQLVELESQLRIKLKSKEKRSKLDAEEEESLLKQIETQREKVRRAYLQEIAEIERQGKIKSEARNRQLEIARRLEQIRIDEARQKDEDEATQKRLLHELIHASYQSNQRSALASPASYRFNHHTPLPWRAWYSDLGAWDIDVSGISELLHWCHSWQASLHQIYLRAPLSHLRELSRCLDAESVRAREVIRQRSGITP